MKNFLNRLPLICLLVMVCGLFSSCDPTKQQGGSFEVSVKEVGPGYVDVQVKAPTAVKIAYMVSKKEQIMNNPAVMFASGTTLTVQAEDTFRVSKGLEENTQYYLYVVAALDAQNYSEIVMLPFKTTKYELTELITVVDRSLDGFKVRITVPEETKQRGNAIRYAHSCLLQYNYSTQVYSSDDYSSLLYNGGATTKYVEDDTTLSYSEDENWYQTDQDSDQNGILDWENYWNPISPGEPIVFLGGEFAWMDGDDDALLDVNGEEIFGFPAGWKPGYYMPLIDPTYYGATVADGSGNEQSSMGVITDWTITHRLDQYWTGAFQRKLFHNEMPGVMDANVDFELAALTPVEAILHFTPQDGVYQYCVGLFDSSTYNELLKLLTIDGVLHEEYLQWAITSYFAANVFPAFGLQGEQYIAVSDLFYVTNLPAEETFHVLITAMSDEFGTKQSFSQTTFQLKPKVLAAPKVIVTADPENSTPFHAAFNIRCEDYETVPVTSGCYAANYVRDWKLALNSGSTYSSLVLSNAAYGSFYDYELYGYEYKKFDKELGDSVLVKVPGINSAEGLTIKIPTIDGETTRCAVLAYNEELTPNNLDGYEFIEDCPAVADLTTPYAPYKPAVSTKHYLDLTGDWTISATLQNGSDEKDTFVHTSNVTISADVYDYPSSLSQDVYDIYKKAGKDKDVVDGFYSEFKEMAETFTLERLVNQNRLLCVGWLDKAQYNRLEARTPYDLFIAEDYSSIDVSSIYNDFGPKWYIEAVENEDGTISYKVPFDDYLLPPSLNWSVPFFLSAMEIDDYYTIMHAEMTEDMDVNEAYNNMLSFPVEVSEDRNTITIYPFVYGGSTYYPNMIGIDSTYGTLLDYPVISKVVLTRGGSSAPKSFSAVPAGNGVKPNAEFPVGSFKSITPFGAEPVKFVERKHFGLDQVRENADRYFENLKSSKK